MTVLLTDGTVGKTDTDVTVGISALVYLHDENGNIISVQGEVAEILE